MMKKTTPIPREEGSLLPVVLGFLFGSPNL
jgi:hypothetical protein